MTKNDGKAERRPFYASADFEPLVIACESRPGNGEDSYAAAVSDNAAFLGVFDGCGGSGARSYSEYGGKTGAYIASRAAAEAAINRFGEWTGKENPGPPPIDRLKNDIDEVLTQYRSESETHSMLRGSLSKEFPTTIASEFILPDAEDDNVLKVDFAWAGDSRCYVLTPAGLRQASTDDLSVTDAYRNLSEDAALLNVISASHSYKINERKLKIRKPCILFTATDGCFGYLRTPMEFERMLIGTLIESKSVSEWKEYLTSEIGKVAGDDYTMCALAFGFESFENMQKLFRERLQYLQTEYPVTETDPAALEAMWNVYKESYQVKTPERKNKNEN